MRIGSIRSHTFALVGLLALSGCATITSSEVQTVSVNTRASDGRAVDKANCTLRNDKGTWEIVSPGFAAVHRSAEDLVVECKKEGVADGFLRAISRAASGMFGNIIFGGAVGAIIDHNKGTGYDYPDELPVEMGASITVDKQQVQGSPSPPAQDQNSNAFKASVASIALTIPSLPPKDLTLPDSMPQVGDTWTYSLIDQRYRPQDRSRQFTHRIVRASTGQIVEAVTRSDSTSITETRFDSGIKGHLRLGMLELSPFLGVFHDLRPGRQWGAVAVDGSVPMGAIGSATVQPFVLSGGRTLGRESITVPAGTFEATRVEFSGSASEAALGIAANSFSGMRAHPFTLSAWYSTKAKRLVRLVVQSPLTRDAYELEEYALR